MGTDFCKSPPLLTALSKLKRRQDGRTLLDFTSGIGVTSLGHAHPDVTQAIIAQAQSIIHVQCAIALSEPYVQLVESLLQMMPHPSLDSFFFWNSGSEAVEAAIKVVRTKTRRNNIIVMQGGYHGRFHLPARVA